MDGGMMRRILAGLISVALLTGVGAAAYWAGINAVVPPALPTALHPVQTYIVSAGTVGRTENVGVTAAWDTVHTIFGAADGVVTAVHHRPGAVARAGQVLATVELRPVVVAQGLVPMFRTLRRGAHGPDVRQFQQLLRATRFLNARPTGTFDAATVASTRRWQRSIGVKADGIVRASDIVFVSTLPARLLVVPGVGSRVASGSEFVRVLGTSPSFSATVSGSTRSELTTGMTVSIAAPDRSSTWTARLGAFVPTEDGRYRAPLSDLICDAACDALSVTGETALRGKVVLVPERQGVVVPVSALVQSAAGSPAVTLADGQLHEVRVVAQADGFAIVDGLAAGTPIMLPDEPAPPSGS